MYNQVTYMLHSGGRYRQENKNDIYYKAISDVVYLIVEYKDFAVKMMWCIELS